MTQYKITWYEMMWCEMTRYKMTGIEECSTRKQKPLERPLGEAHGQKKWISRLKR